MLYLEGCNTSFTLSAIKKANQDWVITRRMGGSPWIWLLARERTVFHKWCRTMITQRSGIRRWTRAQEDIEDCGLDWRKKGCWWYYQPYSGPNLKSMDLPSTWSQIGGIGGSKAWRKARSSKSYEWMVESPSILVTETIACRGSRIPEIIQQNKEGTEIWKDGHPFL